MCFYKIRSLAQGTCFLQYSLSHFLIAFRKENCYIYSVCEGEISDIRFNHTMLRYQGNERIDLYIAEP